MRKHMIRPGSCTTHNQMESLKCIGVWAKSIEEDTVFSPKKYSIFMPENYIFKTNLQFNFSK